MRLTFLLSSLLLAVLSYPGHSAISKENEFVSQLPILVPLEPTSSQTPTKIEHSFNN